MPILYATSQDLHEPAGLQEKTYVCTFQVVGILGLPELDLAHLDAPYADWPRIPVTSKQREAILRQSDSEKLAQERRILEFGDRDYDLSREIETIKEARNQFLTMDGLYWVEESLMISEIEKVARLQPLLKDIRPETGKSRIRLSVLDDTIKLEQKQQPRKTFYDLVAAQNGIKGAYVNGNGG
jgi:hypothetical protein